MKLRELRQIIREEISKQKILVPRRSPEERKKNWIIALNKKIQQYIKDGSKGNLNLGGTPIQKLPSNLTKVGGDLNLRRTLITSLPNNLKIGGDLNLYYTQITSLPKDLQVGGNLHLGGTQITSLPDNLIVGGYLGLDGTPITSLPNNLKVRWSLNLNGTPISSLPNNLQVGGDLNLQETPIAKKYTEEEIRKMVPGVKGEIYI